MLNKRMYSFAVTVDNKILSTYRNTGWSDGKQAVQEYNRNISRSHYYNDRSTSRQLTDKANTWQTSLSIVINSINIYFSLSPSASFSLSSTLTPLSSLSVSIHHPPLFLSSALRPKLSNMKHRMTRQTLLRYQLIISSMLYYSSSRLQHLWQW